MLCILSQICCKSILVTMAKECLTLPAYFSRSLLHSTGASAGQYPTLKPDLNLWSKPARATMLHTRFLLLLTIKG